MEAGKAHIVIATTTPGQGCRAGVFTNDHQWPRPAVMHFDSESADDCAALQAWWDGACWYL